MKIGFIDHYDSFSFNLVDWICADQKFSIEVDHAYFDDQEKLTYLYNSSFPLVFSPGPKSPAEIPQSFDLLERSLGRVPVLGVCLGFQLLGKMAGLTVAKAKNARHGVSRDIDWRLPRLDSGTFENGSSNVAIYNSLGIGRDQSNEMVSNSWDICGQDADGNAQVLIYQPLESLAPALGLQFHPESFLSTGVEVFRNWWLARVERFEAAVRPQQ